MWTQDTERAEERLGIHSRRLCSRAHPGAQPRLPGLTWGPENGSGNDVPKNKPKVTLYSLGN